MHCCLQAHHRAPKSLTIDPCCTGCHGKIDWSNWGKCKCDKGWTGKSCDTLETCTKGMKPLCPMSRLKTLNVKCEQFPVAITIGTAAMGLPTSLQGVFTSINPEASHVPDKLPSDVDEQGGADGNSFIMSFAQSADGDGIGQVYPNGDDAGYQLTIRTHGDRTWSDAVPIPKQPDITKVLGACTCGRTTENGRAGSVHICVEHTEWPRAAVRQTSCTDSNS